MRKGEQAHLEAILAAPAEDAPRLAYAAWLTERGDPRGELIAVECERKRLHNGGLVLDSARWSALVARDTELLAQHRAEWDAPLAETRLTLHWERGFPSIIGSALQVLAAGPLLRYAPIDSLTLTAAPDDTLAGLARQATLARVQRLELSTGDRQLRTGAVGDAGLTALARSPHLTSLRQLAISWNDIGVPGLLALAEASWLPSLTSLQISDNPLGGEGLVALARPPRLSGLRELALFGSGVHDSGAAALAAAEMHALVRLNLSNTWIGDAGVVALAGSPSLGAVTSLMLSMNPSCHDPGAVALARSPHLGALVELQLGNCSVADEGAAAFAAAAERAGLVRLDLVSNRVGAAGGRALADSTALAALRELNLERNVLGVDGVSAFVAGRGLPSLARLGVSNNIETGATERWTDWNGADVGCGPVLEDLQTTAARFASKPGLYIT